MKSALRIAAYTFAAAAALTLAACSSNFKNPAFAKPASLPPQIMVTEDAVAGMKWTVTDEEGPYWVKTDAGGKLTAGYGSQTNAVGTWEARNGLLCLKSKTWWSNGSCWTIYGGATMAEASLLHPDDAGGPHAYYKIRQE